MVTSSIFSLWQAPQVHAGLLCNGQNPKRLQTFVEKYPVHLQGHECQSCMPPDKTPSLHVPSLTNTSTRCPTNAFRISSLSFGFEVLSSRWYKGFFLLSSLNASLSAGTLKQAAHSLTPQGTAGPFKSPLIYHIHLGAAPGTEWWTPRGH